MPGWFTVIEPEKLNLAGQSEVEIDVGSTAALAPITRRPIVGVGVGVLVALVVGVRVGVLVAGGATGASPKSTLGNVPQPNRLICNTWGEVQVHPSSGDAWTW